MITLKFHQLLQLLEFASSKIAENGGHEIFDTLVTVKPLNEASGDVGLYAWLSENPEAGSVKLEAEMPDELIDTVEETLEEDVMVTGNTARWAAGSTWVVNAEDANAEDATLMGELFVDTSLMSAADIRLAANLTASDCTFDQLSFEFPFTVAKSQTDEL